MTDKDRVNDAVCDAIMLNLAEKLVAVQAMSDSSGRLIHVGTIFDCPTPAIVVVLVPCACGSPDCSQRETYAAIEKLLEPMKGENNDAGLNTH